MYLYSENHRKGNKLERSDFKRREVNRKIRKVLVALINGISMKNCVIVRFLPAVNLIFSYLKVV